MTKHFSVNTKNLVTVIHLLFILYMTFLPAIMLLHNFFNDIILINTEQKTLILLQIDCEYQ